MPSAVRERFPQGASQLRGGPPAPKADEGKKP